MHAKAEVSAVVPNVDLSDAQWSTYRVDRAELKTASGRRPEGVTLLSDGNVMTAWPTKLVLAPQLAEDVIKQMAMQPTGEPVCIDNWPRPDVALPPWEITSNWITLD